jgi:hypothetical protein
MKGWKQLPISHVVFAYETRYRGTDGPPVRYARLPARQNRGKRHIIQPCLTVLEDTWGF